MKSILNTLDRLQKSHPVLAFIFALQKKFGDDQSGHHVAMLTYYAFLSVFPLLLVATSVLQILLHSHPAWRDSVISDAFQYMPIIGQQLQSSVHSMANSGVFLAVGLLATLWGAKGIAEVFQSNINDIWHVPKRDRLGFPKRALKSFGLILTGGVGVLAASSLSGLAAAHDRTFGLRALPVTISIALLLATFYILFKWALAKPKATNRSLLFSALIAAAGIQILQSVGGYLMTHQLNHLTTLYGSFALTLGILYWFYLQSLVVMYAVQAGSVYQQKLWPRSLIDKK